MDRPPRRLLINAFLVAACLFFSVSGWVAESSEEYEHPAGYISVSTVREMRQKYSQYDWAKKIVAKHQAKCAEWLEQDIGTILSVIPKKRVGVYHLFTCPESKVRLAFSPFEDDHFRSPETGRVFRAAEPSPVYPKESPHYGTYYDGWGCLFVLQLFDACYRSGLLYQILEEPQYAEWVSRVLVYYTDEVVPNLVLDENFGPKRILTYAREGDAIYLNNLIMAYELVRNAGFLSEPEKRRIEDRFIRVICDKAIMDDEYRRDHNNIPHFQGTVIHAGIAIGEPRYLEFGFGYGDYAPERRPEHRSLAYIAGNHFKDDGAHIDVCSGYHLYAATPFYRNLYIGHNLSQNAPESFPPEIFDYFSQKHPRSSSIRGVARWASAMATFDGILPTVGDSMAATASCMTYDPFGEIAYRYCGFSELGLEEPIIQGERPDNALIVGLPTIETKEIETRSANLSSGYAVLKRNGIYTALNALIPGGGHQHADRLNLILYTNERLMGMEKATPYNDMSLRGHCTFSWAHNTVVVDRTSQPQGERLQPEQVPRVTAFLDHPKAGVMRAEGNRLYESTSLYSRTVVQVGSILVDFFHVKGGETHDFVYHNYGETFLTDVTLAKSTEAFDTPDYVLGGKKSFESAAVEKNVRATWSFPAVPDSVYPTRHTPAAMSLTLLSPESAGLKTTVCHLLTQPFEPHNPLTHTFLARREGPENTFVSVFESTLGDARPTVQDAVWQQLPDGASEVRLTLRDETIVLLVRQNGETTRGTSLTTDGQYAAVAYPHDGSAPNWIVLGAGRQLDAQGVKIELDQTATAVLVRETERRWSASVYEPVQYITRASGNEYPASRTVSGRVRFEGSDAAPFRAGTPSAENRGEAVHISR